MTVIVRGDAGDGDTVLPCPGPLGDDWPEQEYDAAAVDGRSEGLLGA